MNTSRKKASLTHKDPIKSDAKDGAPLDCLSTGANGNKWDVPPGGGNRNRVPLIGMHSHYSPITPLHQADHFVP